MSKNQCQLELAWHEKRGCYQQECLALGHYFPIVIQFAKFKRGQLRPILYQSEGNCLVLGRLGGHAYWILVRGSPVNIILKQYQRENIMEKQVESGANLVDLDGSEASQQTGYRHLDNKEIDELYTSYNLMKQFCEHIPPQSSENSIQILQKYAEKSFKFELLPKNVMHILDNRIQRMLKNKKLKKNWSSQDAEILCWTFSHYCRINGIKSVEQTTLEDWQKISKLIPGSNPDSCMFKILSLKKVKLAKQKWTEEESRLLLQIAIHYPKKNWRSIAQDLYKRNANPTKIFRNAKQCKQHWVCYLNPDLKKGSWALEEDKKLMQHVFRSNGSRKWAEIARIFGGRTENALKNRYTLILERLRRQKNFTNADHDLELIKEYLEKLTESEEISSERKSIKEKRRPNTTRSPSKEEKEAASEVASKIEGIQQKKQSEEKPKNTNLKMVYSFFTFPTAVNMAPSFLNYPTQGHTSVPVPYYPGSANPIFFVYPSFNGPSQQ